jgi:hypothetical protein
MATIDSKNIIDDIIAKDGYYEDDPRVFMIIEYTNAYGNQTWGVTWINDRDKYKYLNETAFVKNPKVVWRMK